MPTAAAQAASEGRVLLRERVSGSLVSLRHRGALPLLAVQAVVLLPLLVSFTNGRLRFPAYRVDLDVYRLGSTVLLHGGSIYGTLPLTQDGQHLPFTYPPFAAIFLAPLAMLPYWLASVVMTLLTVTLLAIVLAVALRSVDALPTGPKRWLLFAALLTGAEVIEPVRTAIYAGQVDVLLLALVALDVLVDSPRWPRGLLVGVAAALKLTPAVFVLYFLFRRDGRAALTAGVTFVVATGIGFVADRADSLRYWTGLAFDDTRIGTPSYAGNQSLLGLISRFGVPTAERTLLWLALVAVTIAVTALGMRRALAAGQFAIALGLNAVCGLLISPISWTHHWVWVVVVLAGWAVQGWRGRQPAALVVAAVGLVVFLAAPQWWWPRGGTVEQQWPLLAQLTGNAYVYAAVALLVLAATYRYHRVPAGPSGPPRDDHATALN